MTPLLHPLAACTLVSVNVGVLQRHGGNAAVKQFVTAIALKLP